MSSTGYVSTLVRCPASGVQVFLSQFWVSGILTVIASVKAIKKKFEESSELCRLELCLYFSERLVTTSKTMENTATEPSMKSYCFYSTKLDGECGIDIEHKDGTAELKIYLMTDSDSDNDFSLLKLAIINNSESPNDHLDIVSRSVNPINSETSGWVVTSGICVSDSHLDRVTLQV